MLKSHFNLKYDDVEEQLKEEEQLDETQEVPAEEIEVFDVRALNRSEISVRLSFLGKTAGGEGYTFLKATCTGMKLTDITAFNAFQNLQFIDVSHNFLDLEALQVVTKLPYLVVIQADKNKLHSAALNKCKYLQIIIMNDNKLTTVENVFQPELSTLEVGDNKITKIYFENRMPTLRCLDFRNNLIQDVQGMDHFPILDSLFLAGNRITSLVGIEKLVNLRVLHVRNNPIRFLYGFEPVLTKLQYINLRNCKIATLRQVRKLAVLESLNALVLKGTPYMGGTGEEDQEVQEEEDPEIRVEVLAGLPRLIRLNKTPYTPEERQEAKDLMTQWLEEGDKEEDEEVDEQPPEEEENAEDP